MLTEEIGDTSRGRNRVNRLYLASVFVVLVFAAMIYPQQTHAQLTGTMEADIPFQFPAGNTKLPAGKYFTRMLDDSSLSLIELSKPDGSVAVLLQVREADANSVPPNCELVFNRYGNKYFLEKLFDEGQSSGSQVSESGYENRLGRAEAEAQEHVPAHRAQPRSGN